MKKITGYMIGLVSLLGGVTQNAGAATLSEMRLLNASQKLGMMILCRQTSEIPQKNESPVHIESILNGKVLQNDGDRMVLM